MQIQSQRMRISFERLGYRFTSNRIRSHFVGHLVSMRRKPSSRLCEANEGVERVRQSNYSALHERRIRSCNHSKCTPLPASQHPFCPAQLKSNNSIYTASDAHSGQTHKCRFMRACSSACSAAQRSVELRVSRLHWCEQ